MYRAMFRYMIVLENFCFPPTMSGRPERNFVIMRNVRLDICYDGTKYKGFQRLPGNQQTIQGKLEQTLSRLLDEPIEVSASGRTDAGTHAEGQVVSFHCSSQMTCEEMLEGLRQYLPEDIGVLACKNASPRFHARLNAKSKSYRYRIWNSQKPCVFDRKYVYIDRTEYDIAKMQKAAEFYLGTYDFSAFSRGNFVILTINAFQRTSLKKYRSSYSVTVMNGKMLNIKYSSCYIIKFFH